MFWLFNISTKTYFCLTTYLIKSDIGAAVGKKSVRKVNTEWLAPLIFYLH